MRLWKREIFYFSVAGSLKDVLSRVAQFTSIGDCVFEYKESAVLEDINNMGTIADSRRTGKGHPEQNPADSLACSGLRARLRLEQRLRRSKHGSRLWWLKLSSEILGEVSSN